MTRPQESPPDTVLSPQCEDTKYRDLLDGLPHVVFESDLDGRLVYVNRNGLVEFGYTEEELARGLSITQMVSPEERDHLRANVARRLAGGPPERFQYTALRRDGTTFPGYVHSIVVQKDGRPVGLQGCLIDISDRASVDAALRSRIALEQVIMRISNGLVAKLAPRELDQRIEEALGEIGRLLDADRSYVFLMTSDGCFIDNTHEWVGEGISSEKARMQRLPVESRFPWFARELRHRLVVPVPRVANLPVDAAAERVEFDRQGIRSLICVAMIQGDGLGGFLGLDVVRKQRDWAPHEASLLRVVGEMFMGAIERCRAEMALQESEHKYKAMVETTATGFVILDEQGAVLDANLEYVRMTGYRALSDIRGRNVMEWTAIHDQARNVQALRTCQLQGCVRDLQIDYARPDGTTAPVLINATASEFGGRRQILTLLRDMSDRKRLEQEILCSEKLRSVGVLAGGIAHDFNNILTAILGNISLLQTMWRADPEVRQHLAEVEMASQRARELTRQLLTFSRGGEPIRRPFLLAPLVRECASLALRGRATASEIHVAPDLPPVDGDEGQIGQVIRNLVINASQAMGGGGKVNIAARAESVREGDFHALTAGTYVTISVADSGEGISEEHRSRIFDPYFTTKRDGRGLGLAVSHSVVTNHKGAITVKSQRGRGSVFTVYLPVSDEPVVPLVATKPLPAVGRGRVLVMDDEESIREIASKILRTLGYEVTFAVDGREAIDNWKQAKEEGRPFSVVIMDLTVPGGMGGREAIRSLLAIDPLAKAIVSSGYSEDPVMANYRDYGFREVLAKPYNVADLSRVLVSALA